MSQIVKIYFLLQLILVSGLPAKPHQEVTIDYSSLNISGLRSDENRLRFQIAELGISSPENIIENFCSGNIEETCHKFKITTQIVHKAYAGYSQLKKDNLYVKLFEGMERLNGYCLNKVMIKKIIMNQACYNELHEEILDCEAHADWYEDTNSTVVCNTCESILNCYFVKIANLCGSNSAHLFKCFAKSIFNATLNHECKLPSNDPFVENPMYLESSANLENTKINLIVIYILCIVRLLNL